MLKNMNCIIIIIIITLEGIKKIKTEKKWQQRSLNNYASMRAEDFKISISPREMHHHTRQSDDKSVEPLTFKTGKTALKGESDNFPVTVSPVRFHRYVFVVELRGKQKEKHVLHKFSKVRLNTGKLGCISPKSRKQWRQDQDDGFIICNFNFAYNPTIGHVKLA